MKFNVPSKTLYSAVSSVSKVINSKNALTILDNFLVELNDDVLTVTGSDLENSLTARIAVTEAEGSGRFCICARRLVELLREMPDQGITFSINDTTLEIEIEYSSGNYTLVAITGDEYPTFKPDPDEKEPISFECATQDLIKGIDNTIFAVGNDDLRPMMMGIFFDIKPDSVTFVATDTRKLVRYICHNIVPGVEGNCLLPVKPSTIIKNVFAKEERMKLTMNTKNATIESENFTFKCCFLNGRFPDYNRVIPKNNPYTLTADRLSFLTAVRRVGVFVDPAFGLEKFRITPERVLLKSSDQGNCTSAREQVPCSFTGQELTIGFSAPYLIEILNTIPTEDIIVELSDPSRPGLFRPTEDAEGTELLMLLMPMTVGEF